MCQDCILQAAGGKDGRGRGKICGVEDDGGVAALEADPGIFPRLAAVRIVGDLRLGIDEEGIPGIYLIGLAIGLVEAFSGNDMVD